MSINIIFANYNKYHKPVNNPLKFDMKKKDALRTSTDIIKENPQIATHCFQHPDTGHSYNKNHSYQSACQEPVI